MWFKKYISCLILFIHFILTLFQTYRKVIKCNSIQNQEIDTVLLSNLETWFRFHHLCLLSISFGEGNGTPLQYSCLENPMDGGAWWAAVHGVARSRTQLSDFTFIFHFHALEKEMATTPVFLPGESQGRGRLVGCRLWGRTESDTTEVT